MEHSEHLFEDQPSWENEYEVNSRYLDEFCLQPDEERVLLHLGKTPDFPHMLFKAFNSKLPHCFFSRNITASQQYQNFLWRALNGLGVNELEIECFIFEHPEISATAIVLADGRLICVGQNLGKASELYFKLLHEWGYAESCYSIDLFSHLRFNQFKFQEDRSN